MPIEEQVALLEELQEDKDIHAYLLERDIPYEAMEELKKRDKAFQEGKVKLYSWEDVKAKLILKPDS